MSKAAARSLDESRKEEWRPDTPLYEEYDLREKGFSDLSHARKEYPEKRGAE